MRWIAGAALVAVMVAGGRVVCQEPWDDLFVGDSIADDWFKRAAETLEIVPHCTFLMLESATPAWGRYWVGRTVRDTVDVGQWTERTQALYTAADTLLLTASGVDAKRVAVMSGDTLVLRGLSGSRYADAYSRWIRVGSSVPQQLRARVAAGGCRVTRTFLDAPGRSRNRLHSPLPRERHHE